MASGYGKKSTLKNVKDKAVSGLKKTLAGVLAVGAFVGTPVWYHYGTIEETEVKVKDTVENYVGWDDKEDVPLYEFKIKTDKGAFENANTYAHLKFDSKDLHQQFNSGKTYKIRYYGKRFDVPFTSHDFFPNILSAREVTEAEIAEREKAKAKNTAKQAAAAQTPAAAQQPVPGQPQLPAAQTFNALSGRVVTYDLVTPDAKYTVQVTGPIEVAGKLTVNAVTPLQPAAPAPRPPQP